MQYDHHKLHVNAKTTAIIHMAPSTLASNLSVPERTNGARLEDFQARSLPAGPYLERCFDVSGYSCGFNHKFYIWFAVYLAL